MSDLTAKIKRALDIIVEEEHTMQNGVRDSLFDSVGPLFDQEASFFPLRPSSCLKPMRDLYYDLINFYEPGTIPKAGIEPRVKLIFQFGHLTETLLKKVFGYTYGVQNEQERVTYGELIDKDGSTIKLTGSIDWASYVGGTELILCDAKSSGDYPFKKAPKADNIAQMQLYMASDWGRKNNVNKAILIYFNKNTSDIKCIEVPYVEELAKNLLARMQEVFDYYKARKLPPREYVAGLDWEADYSSYKDYDNRAFTVHQEERKNNIVLDVEYAAGRNPKAELRDFIKNYEDSVVVYLDKTVYVTYNKGKLELIIKEN